MARGLVRGLVLRLACVGAWVGGRRGGAGSPPPAHTSALLFRPPGRRFSFYGADCVLCLRVHAALRTNTHSVGAPFYLAPEVADADMAAAGYTAHVDVFSFGVMAAVLMLQLQWPGAAEVWDQPAGGAGAPAVARPAVLENLPRPAVIEAASTRACTFMRFIRPLAVLVLVVLLTCGGEPRSPFPWSVSGFSQAVWRAGCGRSLAPF